MSECVQENCQDDKYRKLGTWNLIQATLPGCFLIQATLPGCFEIHLVDADDGSKTSLERFQRHLPNRVLCFMNKFGIPIPKNQIPDPNLLNILEEKVRMSCINREHYINAQYEVQGFERSDIDDLEDEKIISILMELGFSFKGEIIIPPIPNSNHVKVLHNLDEVQNFVRTWKIPRIYSKLGDENPYKKILSLRVWASKSSPQKFDWEKFRQNAHQSRCQANNNKEAASSSDDDACSDDDEEERKPAAVDMGALDDSIADSCGESYPRQKFNGTNNTETVTRRGVLPSIDDSVTKNKIQAVQARTSKFANIVDPFSFKISDANTLTDLERISTVKMKKAKIKLLKKKDLSDGLVEKQALDQQGEFGSLKQKAKLDSSVTTRKISLECVKEENSCQDIDKTEDKQNEVASGRSKEMQPTRKRKTVTFTVGNENMDEEQRQNELLRRLDVLKKRENIIKELDELRLSRTFSTKARICKKSSTEKLEFTNSKLEKYITNELQRLVTKKENELEYGVDDDDDDEREGTATEIKITKNSLRLQEEIRKCKTESEKHCCLRWRLEALRKREMLIKNLDRYGLCTAEAKKCSLLSTEELESTNRAINKSITNELQRLVTEKENTIENSSTVLE